MPAAIVCDGLTKRYGNVLALDRLTLEVEVGTIFGFLGPNGAGKTTTVRLLTGLARPSSGSATVAGIDVASGRLALSGKMSYLEQQPRLYGWMRGRELLELVCDLHGIRGASRKSRIDEVLELVGLTDAARRKISGYSGGMRQRLGLAQALVNEPEIAFLDEPVSALDPQGRYDVLHAIDQLRGRVTVFMSTHILADVERICDVVAIMDRGSLVVTSSVPALLARYAQPIFVLEPEPCQDAALAELLGEMQAQSWCIGVMQEGEELRVSVSDVTVASRAILTLVVQHAVALARYEQAQPSLEDIFLQLVHDPGVEKAR